MRRGLHCTRCGVLVGYTSTTRPLSVQCSSPLCAALPSSGPNEDRDSAIELCYDIGIPPAEIGRRFWMTGKNVTYVLSRLS